MIEAETQPRRGRKQANDRIADLLEVADAIIRRDRSADLALKDVADHLGISRALVYAYFTDRFRLIEAVLARHVALLEAAGLREAARAGPLAERAVACADIYLRHVAAHGPVFELVLRENDVARQLDGAAARFRRQVLRSLARQAMVELRMGSNEALALVELLTTIPQEAARRAGADGLPLATAQAVCERLTRALVAAQMPQR